MDKIPKSQLCVRKSQTQAETALQKTAAREEQIYQLNHIYFFRTLLEVKCLI